ncbi:caspase-like [Anopheles albimanus]|uniref:caspase-like n=1 Tax=Anopheles albimanus TaxID=7167 RepID=UPI00163E9791|nr:caspase-like [Anopheles albimanus]
MTHGDADKLHAYDDSYLTKQLWKFFVDECPSLNGKPKLIFIQACRGNAIDAGVSVQNMEKITRSVPVKMHEQSVKIDGPDAKPLDGPSSEMLGIGMIEEPLEKEPSNQPPSIKLKKNQTIVSETEVEAGDTITSQTDSIPLVHSNEVTGNKNVCESLKIAIPTTPDMLVMYATTDGYVSLRNTAEGSWFIQSLCAELRANGDKKELLQMLTSVSRMVAYHFKYEDETEGSSEKKT